MSPHLALPSCLERHLNNSCVGRLGQGCPVRSRGLVPPSRSCETPLYVYFFLGLEALVLLLPHLKLKDREAGWGDLPEFRGSRWRRR